VELARPQKHHRDQFAAFLAPFLGLAIALSAAGLLADRAAGRQAGLAPQGWVYWPSRAGVAASAAVLLLAAATVVEARAESHLSPVAGPSAIAAAQRIIPPDACVLSDNASLLLLADRFESDVRGCGVIDDGLGTDLALSHGLTPANGAGGVPAVAQAWSEAFDHAGFVWFSDHSWRRIAWSPALLGYFRRDFRPVLTDRFGDTIYQRREPGSSAPR
jgi:hypothetical protein